MREYDAVIIGAGILGLSTALQIKKKKPDAEVLVVEKMSGPGRGNTAKSWACFRNFFSSNTNYILADTTIDFYKHVQENLGVDLQMDSFGYLFLFNKEDYKKRESILRDMAKKGLEYRIYEGQEIAEKLKMNLGPHDEESRAMGLVDIDLGLMIPKAGSLDSDSIVRFFESEFIRLGGEVRYNTPVRKITIEPINALGDPWEPYIWQDVRVNGVETNAGIIKAKKTIVAAGSWATGLLDPLGIDSHSRPEKKHVFFAGADTEALKTLLRAKGLNSTGCLPYVMINCIPHNSTQVSILPKLRGDSFWLGTSSSFMREFKLEEEPVADKRIFEFDIHQMLPKYFPQFANAKMTNSWAGQYELNTFDGQPVILERNDLILVGASSGSGVMKADAIGRITASLYAEEEYAKLYGGKEVKVSNFSIEERRLEFEKLVL
jgi:glycine/D-amino acid oxidase-like deaminating enzyme